MEAGEGVEPLAEKVAKPHAHTLPPSPRRRPNSLHARPLRDVLSSAAAPLLLLDLTCSTAMSAPPPRVNTESARASMSPPTRG